MPYSLDKLTGGTASTDSFYNATSVASKACDDDTGTQWLTANVALPHWWKYDFGAGIAYKIEKFTHYGTPGNATGIKNFKIQGSNNDSTWSDLYTGTAQSNTTREIFTFTNNVAYRYMRVWVTSGYRTDVPNLVGTWEFEMMVRISGGFSGVSNPWVFMKEAWERHNKLWTPKGLILPKDLSFQI